MIEKLILAHKKIWAEIFSFFHHRYPKLKSKWRTFCFIFSFFLINKYHCNFSPTTTRYIWILHKIFWAFVIFCMFYTIGKGIEEFKMFLHACVNY